SSAISILSACAFHSLPLTWTRFLPAATVTVLPSPVATQIRTQVAEKPSDSTFSRALSPSWMRWMCEVLFFVGAGSAITTFCFGAAITYFPAGHVPTWSGMAGHGWAYTGPGHTQPGNGMHDCTGSGSGSGAATWIGGWPAGIGGQMAGVGCAIIIGGNIGAW